MQGDNRFTPQAGGQAGHLPGFQIARYQIGEHGGGEPEAGGLLHHVFVLFGQCQAEELGLRLFQRVLFLDQADFVVRQLLQAGGAFCVGQLQVFGDGVDFPGELAEDFLAAAQSLAEDADADQAALVDLSIDGARGDEVVDRGGFAFLPVAVDPADALFHAHGVPGQVVIHQAIAELKIQAFATDFGREQHIQGLRVGLVQAETVAQFATLVVGDVAVDEAQADGCLGEVSHQIGQGVAEGAEHQQFVVGQCLLVANDFKEGIELGIGAGEISRLLNELVDFGAEDFDRAAGRLIRCAIEVFQQRKHLVVEFLDRFQMVA